MSKSYSVSFSYYSGGQWGALINWWILSPLNGWNVGNGDRRLTVVDSFSAWREKVIPNNRRLTDHSLSPPAPSSRWYVTSLFYVRSMIPPSTKILDDGSLVPSLSRFLCITAYCHIRSTLEITVRLVGSALLLYYSLWLFIVYRSACWVLMLIVLVNWSMYPNRFVEMYTVGTCR